MEVKNAAVNSLSKCVAKVAAEKITNFILPTINKVYADSNIMFKASLPISLGEIAKCIGKEATTLKILPIMQELLKDDHSEVKLNSLQ
jgi:hypothetical protein